MLNKVLLILSILLIGVRGRYVYINLYAKGVPPPVPAALIAVAGRGELYTARVARIPRCAAFIAGAGVIRSRR